MELKKAIQILEHHNYWRRDNNEPPKIDMISPKTLGIAIDTILQHFKNNVALDGVSKSLNADELVKSLGEPIKNNEYKLIADDSGVWWLEHKHIGSGEPLKQWLTGKH